MKKITAFLLFSLLAVALVAQTDVAVQLEFNAMRLETIRIHAIILAIWALPNIIIGGYLTYILEDGEPESFHHMNAAWNLINLGVAWAMLHTVNYSDIDSYDLLETIGRHYQAQKLMMLNIGLDVSYMLAGLALFEHSKNNKKFDLVLRGFGKSIILQGAFLFVLDITFHSIHTAQNGALRELLHTYQVNAGI